MMWLNLICVLIGNILGLVFVFNMFNIENTSSDIYNGMIKMGRYFSFVVLFLAVLNYIDSDGRVTKIKKIFILITFILGCVALLLNFATEPKLPNGLRLLKNKSSIQTEVILPKNQLTNK